MSATPSTRAPSTPTWNTLSLDESLALRTAATRLATEFDGVFGTETIERFLNSSFDQFALRATVVKFLPLMAERGPEVTGHRSVPGGAGPAGGVADRHRPTRVTHAHPGRIGENPSDPADDLVITTPQRSLA